MSCPETELRAIWDAKGVSKERQEELLADLTAKARPGAMVGPFKIGEQTTIPETLARSVPSGPLVPKVGQNGAPLPLEMVEEDKKQGRLL